MSVNSRVSAWSSPNPGAGGGLWHGHLATQTQSDMKKRPMRRVTQSQVILGMLRQARSAGEPLSLTAILRTNIAQYSARVAELRQAGHRITNTTTHGDDGRVLSQYVLVHDAELDRDLAQVPNRRPARTEKASTMAISTQGELFSNLAAARVHRDDG
jgi:hypothetical protein